VRGYRCLRPDVLHRATSIVPRARTGGPSNLPRWQARTNHAAGSDFWICPKNSLRTLCSMQMCVAWSISCAPAEAYGRLRHITDLMSS
jgi:hypothetical protein